MKMKVLPFLFAAACLITSCSGNNSSNQTNAADSLNLNTTINPDSVVLSFAFVGCNRVDRHDQDNPAATNASSANIIALHRIFNEVSAMERKPDLFFFLGDLVYAETDTQLLNKQLPAWVAEYGNTTFSPISDSGIEMVAIPGNHEMLYWHQFEDDTLHDEFPLEGATEIWMKYMHGFMPEDRDHVTGVDSVVNQMTFAFERGNVGFVLMNTDTYNGPSEKYPHGREGLIPFDWITNKVSEYQADETIEHIFVLGHKPAYVNGQFDTIHDGFLMGPELWPELMKNDVIAMLSAHEHTYSRVQPENEGTYQVIAGNGGSKDPEFYGYTLINVRAGGDIELISKGFNNDGEHYYNPKPAPENPTTTRDSTVLIWGQNESTFPG